MALLLIFTPTSNPYLLIFTPPFLKRVKIYQQNIYIKISPLNDGYLKNLVSLIEWPAE